MSFASLKNATMTVRREGSVSANAFGGRSGTWADHLTGVQVRVQQTSGDELVNTSGGSGALIASKKIWFDVGVDVKHRDRVVIDGTTYEVSGVDPDVSGAGHHGEAMLVEVRE